MCGAERRQPYCGSVIGRVSGVKSNSTKMWPTGICGSTLVTVAVIVPFSASF